MKVVDIVYHCHHEFNEPGTLLEKHRPTLSFVEFLGRKINYTVVRHLNYHGFEKRNGIQYAFFRRSNKPWQIPFATHLYIRRIKPDLVLVHGFVFPLQVIALKWMLGRRCKIILQHHAEIPMPSLRLFFQKIADHCVDAYTFTSKKTALPWLEQGVIRQAARTHALQGASTPVERKPHDDCKSKLGLEGEANFLWVGRLNANKDPMTVLRAAHSYFQKNEAARLFMIFQTIECLPEMENYLNGHSWLKQRVVLVGKIDRNAIADWYNACEFFVSASHAEAAGYALMEAISAGCIPVVSRIPSYEAMLDGLADSFSFTPGNAEELACKMEEAALLHHAQASLRIKDFFDSNSSPRAVGENLFTLFSELQSV